MSVEWAIVASSNASDTQTSLKLVEDHNSGNKDIRAFHVPASLLTVGTVYTITVTGTLVADPAARNTAAVTITLDPSDVVARIAGGGSRVVGAADAVVVTAACSFDPDDTPRDASWDGDGGGHVAVASAGCDAADVKTVASALGAGLRFYWKCTDNAYGLPCVGGALSPGDAGAKVISLPSYPVLTLNNHTLGVGPTSLRLSTAGYAITMTVCAGTTGACLRNASAAINVLLEEGKPPSVGLTACIAAAGESALVCGQPVPSRVNPTDRLVLNAVVKRASSDAVVVKDSANGTSSVAFAWTEHEYSLHLKPEYFATTLDQTSLVLKAGTLIPRAVYTFRLSANDRIESSTGYAEVTVEVNAPPSSGEVVVSSCDSDGDSGGDCPADSCCGAAMGFVLETQFEVSAVYWVDDADDLPLSFEFNYYIGTADSVDAVEDAVENAVETPMGYESTSNRIRSQLPEGNITVVGRVYDRMMASATAVAEAAVSQRPDVDAVALVTNETQKVLDKLAEGGSSGEEALRSIGLLGDLLNTNVQETQDPTTAPTRAPTIIGDTGVPTDQPTGMPTLDEAAEAARLAKELEEKKRLRERLLQVTLDAQAHVDPSARTMQQQTACIDTLTATPDELTPAAQRSALSMLSNVVNETQSRSLAIKSDTVQAVGRSISSVIEAGILSSGEDDAGGDGDGAGSSDGSSDAVEGDGSAVTVVMRTLGTLSSVILSGTVADEEPITIAAPNVRMASQRRSSSGLSGSLKSPAYVPAGGDIDTAAKPTEFVLPASLIREITVGGTSADEGNAVLDTNVLEFPTSPFGAGASGVAPASTIASLTLHDATNGNGGEEVTVANLTLAPITMQMAISVEKAAALKLEMEAANCSVDFNSSDASNCSVLPQCFYYDTKLQDWSTDGCKATGVSADFRSVTCECTHLTSFMGKIGKTFKAQGERIKTTLEAVKNLSIDAVRQNMVIVATLGILWLVYIAVAIHTCLSGRASQKKMDELMFDRFSRHRSEAEKRHHKLDDDSIFMRTHPSKRAKGTENTAGEKAKDGSEKRSRFDKVTEYLGLKYAQYGLSYKQMLAENHPILSIYYAPNRLDRLTMFMCLLIGQMLIDTLVWDGSMGAKLPDPYSDAKAVLANTTANMELGLINATHVEALKFAMGQVDWETFFAEFLLGFVVELILVPVTFLVMRNLHSAEQDRRRDAVWRSLRYEDRKKWLFCAADCDTALRRLKREAAKEKKHKKTQEKKKARLFKKKGLAPPKEELHEEEATPAAPSRAHRGSGLALLTKSAFNILEKEPPLQTQVDEIEAQYKEELEEEEFAKEDAKRRRKSFLAHHIDTVVHSIQYMCAGITFVCVLLAYKCGCKKKPKEDGEKAVDELTEQQKLDKKREQDREAAENDYFINYLKLKAHPKDELEAMNFFQKLLYKHSVLQMDSSCDVPEVHGYVAHRIKKAYFVAITFMLIASFYIFLFGICGPPEEKSAAEGGGYVCLASGQTEELTVHWIQSLIVFSLVAWCVTRPVSIFVMQIIIPSAALSVLKVGLQRKASRLERKASADTPTNPAYDGSGAGSGKGKKQRTTIVYEGSDSGELVNPMHGNALPPMGTTDEMNLEMNLEMNRALTHRTGNKPAVRSSDIDACCEGDEVDGKKTGNPKTRRSMSQKIRSSLGFKSDDSEAQAKEDIAAQLRALVDRKGQELGLERTDIDMLKQSLACEIAKLVAAGHSAAAKQTTMELLVLSDEDWRTAAAQFLSEEQVIERLAQAGVDTEGLEGEDLTLLREMLLQVLAEKRQQEVRERADQEQRRQAEEERIHELQARAAVAIAHAKARAGVLLHDAEDMMRSQVLKVQQAVAERTASAASVSAVENETHPEPRAKFFRVKKGTAAAAAAAQDGISMQEGVLATQEVERKAEGEEAPSLSAEGEEAPSLSALELVVHAPAEFVV
jgi:hypothetical protein